MRHSLRTLIDLERTRHTNLQPPSGDVFARRAECRLSPDLPGLASARDGDGTVYCIYASIGWKEWVRTPVRNNRTQKLLRRTRRPCTLYRTHKNHLCLAEADLGLTFIFIPKGATERTPRAGPHPCAVGRWSLSPQATNKSPPRCVRHTAPKGRGAEERELRACGGR